MTRLLIEEGQLMLMTDNHCVKQRAFKGQHLIEVCTGPIPEYKFENTKCIFATMLFLLFTNVTSPVSCDSIPLLILIVFHEVRHPLLRFTSLCHPPFPPLSNIHFPLPSQAVVCHSEIKWRKRSRKLVLFSTDSEFHT